MNKDRINIDDFVREKLGAHTEKEDSAAWLKMKALLDKEMPERVAPIGFRFGKPLAFIAAALLLGVLCVGGYQLTNKSNENQENTPNEVITSHNSNTPNSSTTAPDNTLPASKEQIATTSNPVAIENKVATSTVKVSEVLSSKMEEHGDAKAKAPQEVSKNTQEHQLLADENVSHAAHSSRAKSNTIGSVASFAKTHSKIASSKTNTVHTNGLPQRIQDHSIAQTKTESKRSGGSTAKNEKLAQENPLQDKILAGTAGKKVSSALNKANKTEAAKEEPVSDDSISSISIVTKETLTKSYPRKTTNLVDTIAIEKVAVDKASKATDKAMATAESNKKDKTTTKDNNTTKDIKLNASQNQAHKEPSLATNSKTKDNNVTTATETKKKKSSLNFLQKMNLPEAIADAKRDLGNAQFYFGFNAGLNYTFNNNSKFQGVQFGPTGELVFNKRWSLFGAINYFNRSGGKKTVNDNYANEVYSGTQDSIRGANYYFTIRTDSTNRYFNFSTLHSFEMPISLKYTVNKFCVLAGINLAYYLKVNVEEVDKKYGGVNPHVLVTNVSKPILLSSSPQLESSDFGPRFGMGYVLGLGYKITPAWQADIRMVNSFWDNASGNGAQRLSKDFYKLPSIQITIGYQFNRVTNRPTYGPTSTP